MKEIKLTQGKVALVDDAAYEWLSQWKWTYIKPRNVEYAYRKDRGGNNKNIYMHKQILQPPPGMKTDHKDNNGLNNQRHNLRVCTNSQNLGNMPLYSNNTSGYKGVTWRSDIHKWCASIGTGKKRTYLGYFLNLPDAVNAYNSAAQKLFGEFAKLNNVPG